MAAPQENVSQIIGEILPPTGLLESVTDSSSTVQEILSSLMTSKPTLSPENVSKVMEELVTSTVMLESSTQGISTTSPSPPGMEDQMLEIRSTVDTFFILINSCVIFFLQGGFAFLEAGSVRSKNTTNILIKNILDSLMGALAFWFCGYMIANSDGNSFMGFDSRYLCLVDLEASHYTYWFFGFVFCATASTIVSGAVAERCELVAYFAYSTIISALVYPVVVHWAWTSEGWLAVNGYVDFAGSGVVHHLGGVCGFVGALILGPRIGRFGKDGSLKNMPGHSVSLAALGAFILMFGFFSFNGATNASISTYEDRDVVQRAIINTMIGGASSGLVTLIIFRISARKKWSLLSTINGILCGMIATCAFCNKAAPWATFVVGIFAAIAYVVVHYSMIWFRIDDPLDAVAVHSGGGIVGVLATPFVIGVGGVFDAEREVTAMHQIWSQVVGLLVITAWSGGVSLIMFYLLHLNNKLRLPEEIEIKGCDIIKHGESAYPVEAWQEQQYSQDQMKSRPPFMKKLETAPEGNEGWGSIKRRIQHQLRDEIMDDIGTPKPISFRKLETESLETESEGTGQELQGYTNSGFEHDHTVDYGKNVEETSFQNVDVDKEPDNIDVQRIILQHDRTLEFNNSKESTMI